MLCQQYQSSCTSINSTKMPSIFKKVEWQPNTINLDYGGGKYNIQTEYLKTLNVTNEIYDPFNRSAEWNEQALSKAPFDTITLSNVLNVVHEEEYRAMALAHCKSLLKPQGKLYITVYEGNGTNIPTINEKRNSCQLNKPLKDYVKEVAKFFKKTEIKNHMIIAWK